MSVERIFYCDGPDCERSVRTQKQRPPVFVTVLEDGPNRDTVESHFCGWDCVLRHAAAKEPEQIILGDDPVDDKTA